MIFTKRNRQLLANVKKLEELKKSVLQLNRETTSYMKIIEERERVLNKLMEEKTIGFPWLAEAISEFHHYQDVEIARYLEVKKHPAFKKAEEVRETAQENKALRKSLKVAQNFVTMYETLFPWITDYVGESLDGLLENTMAPVGEDQDPVLKFMPAAEFNTLSPTQRNQKALDRYLSSRKLPHEIGRDYERYIGYLYEEQGYQVEYYGIVQGLEDLGRDLVCIKNGNIVIIQCKCWASHKVIHEKHINQLYGTMVKYCIDHVAALQKKPSQFHELLQSGKIKGVLITSTTVSETARIFSDALGIEVVEEKKLERYPIIKCNINNGQKIYHLPFDQQYDRTHVYGKGELYAHSVLEAEQKGFRRAFRWKGAGGQ